MLLQATLAAPPPVLQSMMAGVYAAYPSDRGGLPPIFQHSGHGLRSVWQCRLNADVLLSVQRPVWLIRLANFFVVVHLAASYQVRHICSCLHSKRCTRCSNGQYCIAHITHSMQDVSESEQSLLAGMLQQSHAVHHAALVSPIVRRRTGHACWKVAPDVLPCPGLEQGKRPTNACHAIGVQPPRI